MNREEVVKLINDAAHRAYFREENIAKAIFNLRYDCRECGGAGKRFSSMNCAGILPRCPSCKGTGKDGRMLAVLDEKQIVNMPQPQHDHANDCWKDGYKFAIVQLKDEGWRKTIQEGE